MYHCHKGDQSILHDTTIPYQHVPKRPRPNGLEKRSDILRLIETQPGAQCKEGSTGCTTLTGIQRGTSPTISQLKNITSTVIKHTTHAFGQRTTTLWVGRTLNKQGCGASPSTNAPCLFCTLLFFLEPIYHVINCQQMR